MLENPQTNPEDLQNTYILNLYEIDENFATISKNVLSRYTDVHSAMINRILLEFQSSYKQPKGLFINRAEQNIPEVNALIEPIKTFFNCLSGIGLGFIIIFILTITLSPTFSPSPHWLNILVTSIFQVIGLVSIALFFMVPSFYFDVWDLEEACDIDPATLGIVDSSTFFNFSIVVDGEVRDIDVLRTCDNPPSILKESYNRMRNMVSEGDAIKNPSLLDFSCSAIINTLKKGDIQLCDGKNGFHTTGIAYYSTLTFLQFGGFLIAFGAGRLLIWKKGEEPVNEVKVEQGHEKTKASTPVEVKR